MRGWLCIALVAGCYNPSFQPGRPCTEDGYCPGDQVCDLSQTPPTCVETLGDGGIGNPDSAVDAGPDASLMPDGPVVPCAGGCPATLPVCDSGTSTCRACIADAECPSDVCHELTGECVAEADALYVSPTGTGSACTRTAPCATVEIANQSLTATRKTIKVADGTYPDRFDLRTRPNATTLILSGPDRSAAGPVFDLQNGFNKVQGGLTAVIEGITIAGSENDGIECQGTVTLARVNIRSSGDAGVVGRGTSLKIYDSKIETSSSEGVTATSGVVEIERTQILSSGLTGLRIESGVAYSVINSVIALNGNGLSGTVVGGVRILGSPPTTGPQVFKFNTVARNRGPLAPALGIECGRPVTIQSSIMASSNMFQGEMTGSCTATNSLFLQNAPSSGGNLSGDPMFVSTTDCHVLPGSPAVNAATGSGTPSVDIDGDARSGPDAADIGADEVP